MFRHTDCDRSGLVKWTSAKLPTNVKSKKKYPGFSLTSLLNVTGLNWNFCSKILKVWLGDKLIFSNFSLIVQSLFCSHFLNELFEHILIYKSSVLLLLTTHVLQGQASYMSQLWMGSEGEFNITFQVYTTTSSVWFFIFSYFPL